MTTPIKHKVGPLGRPKTVVLANGLPKLAREVEATKSLEEAEALEEGEALEVAGEA